MLHSAETSIVQTPAAEAAKTPRLPNSLLHHELSALTDIDSGWERLLVVHTLPHDVEEWSGGGMM